MRTEHWNRGKKSHAPDTDTQTKPPACQLVQKQNQQQQQKQKQHTEENKHDFIAGLGFCFGVCVERKEWGYEKLHILINCKHWT